MNTEMMFPLISQQMFPLNYVKAWLLWCSHRFKILLGLLYHAILYNRETLRYKPCMSHTHTLRISTLSVWWHWIKNILRMFLYIPVDVLDKSVRRCILKSTVFDPIANRCFHCHIAYSWQHTHIYKHTYAGPAIGGKHRHCCQTKGHTRSLPFQTQTAERGKITE